MHFSRKFLYRGGALYLFCGYNALIVNVKRRVYLPQKSITILKGRCTLPNGLIIRRKCVKIRKSAPPSSNSLIFLFCLSKRHYDRSTLVISSPFLRRYSIVTPSLLHRFDGVSMEYRWTIDGLSSVLGRRKMEGKFLEYFSLPISFTIKNSECNKAIYE